MVVEGELVAEPKKKMSESGKVHTLELVKRIFLIIRGEAKSRANPYFFLFRSPWSPSNEKKIANR